MVNEHLQGKDTVKNHADTNFNGTAMETQTLLLSAFLEEKKKWEDEIARTWMALDSKTKELSTARLDLIQQSKIKTFFCGLIKIRSTKEKALIKITNEASRIKNKLEKLVVAEPKSNAYELAMLGNSLFKSR